MLTGQGEVRHVQSIEFDNCTELVAAVGGTWVTRSSAKPTSLDESREAETPNLGIFLDFLSDQS